MWSRVIAQPCRDPLDAAPRAGMVGFVHVTVSGVGLHRRRHVDPGGPECIGVRLTGRPEDVDVGVQDEHGRLAAHIPVRRERVRIVERLL